MTTTQGLVQAKASTPAGSTNRVLAFNANVTQGNLLIAAMAYTALSGTPAITDTQGNTWTEVGQVASILNGIMVTLILFWAIASNTGANTVTGSVSPLSSPTNVWMAISEFTGANDLAIISGSTLGYGVNPPYDGSSLNGTIQAVNPPLTTPTNALMIVAATTGNATATWAVDVDNNWYKIAVQSGGIVLAFATNLYSGAPFCDLTPPKPILDRTGDSSEQWVILTAPFTNSVLQQTFQNTNVPSPTPNFQYPSFPYDPESQE